MGQRTVLSFHSCSWYRDYSRDGNYWGISFERIQVFCKHAQNWYLPLFVSQRLLEPFHSNRASYLCCCIGQTLFAYIFTVFCSNSGTLRSQSIACLFWAFHVNTASTAIGSGLTPCLPTILLRYFWIPEDFAFQGFLFWASSFHTIKNFN